MIIEKMLKLHPYEYVLIMKIREARNGKLLVKFQDGLPMVTEVSKTERTDIREEAEKLGLIRKGA